MPNTRQAFNDVLLEERCRSITFKALELIEVELGRDATNAERLQALCQVVEATANHIGGEAYDEADGI